MSEQSERLRACRIAAGYATAAEAARALGIPEGRFAHHDNGTRGFKYAVAEVYAAKFGTTADWLMVAKIPPKVEGGPRQVRDVVKLSWVSAGRLGPADSVESVRVEGKMRVEDLPPGEWVALEVKGRSMERIAPEGSTILVNRKDRTLVNSRYYVFTASDGEATFKRYKASPDRFLPYSLDADEEPIYPDVEDDREWSVFGRVRRILIDI